MTIRWCETCADPNGESCCSIDPNTGLCAGRCDLDKHTFATIDAARAALSARHEDHVRDGENYFDCDACP